jgi:HKD family nuclease
MKFKTLLYENEHLTQFNASLRDATEFSIGMALITLRGLNAIADSLGTCLERGSHGRVLIGIDMPTHPDAIQKLCDYRTTFKTQLELPVFESTGASIFHPKLSIFRSARGRLSAIVGSANLTNGGLSENYEASVFVEDDRAVHSLLEFFNENFKGSHARKIDPAWLVKYREVYRRRDKALRALKLMRDKTRRLRAKRPQSTPAPPRVRGHTFAFTGTISGWPRDRELYPLVRRLGGDVADKAGSMGRANCLVHGNILGGAKSTRKLEVAERRQLPVITDEEFFKIVERERRKRLR